MPGYREATLCLRSGRRELALSAWVRETDSADLWFFVHGLGCSKKSFGGAWEHRALRDQSLIALDLPGFGRSPRPDDYDYALEHQAGFLASLIDANASRRVHLVAHSMGGTLSLLLPTRSLARLHNLVLVEARLLPDSCGVAADAAAQDYAGFTRDYLPKFRRRVNRDTRVSFDVDHADPTGFYCSAQSLLRWAGSGEMVDRFLAAPCPAWFVYGTDNSHLGELDRLPDESLIGIRDAGHFPMQDNPGEFYLSLAKLVLPGSRA